MEKLAGDVVISSPKCVVHIHLCLLIRGCVYNVHVHACVMCISSVYAHVCTVVHECVCHMQVTCSYACCIHACVHTPTSTHALNTERALNFTHHSPKLIAFTFVRLLPVRKGVVVSGHRAVSAEPKLHTPSHRDLNWPRSSGPHQQAQQFDQTQHKVQ